jgi:hypothetical protein
MRPLIDIAQLARTPLLLLVLTLFPFRLGFGCRLGHTITELTALLLVLILVLIVFLLF